jgi:hypothetical protein
MNWLNQAGREYRPGAMVLVCGLSTVAILASWHSPVTTTDSQSIALELDQTFAEPFGYVGGARELSDGRVLIADPLGEIVAIVDLVSGTADTLGRVGAGPREYRHPDALHALTADSTLLVDLGNARFIVVGPGGEFGETLSMTQIGEGGGLTIILPRFVDGAGQLYYEPEHFSAGNSPDSAVILRFDRTDGSIDTIGAVGLARPEHRQASGGVMLERGALLPRDDWAVGDDGRVAIVRSADYSIEWRDANGARARGPATEYHPVRVGRAEKERWLEEFFNEKVSVRTQRTADGRRSMQLSRGTSGGSRPEVEAFEWPNMMPPFRAGRTIVSPDGSVWVERYVSANDPPIIDVFDARGQKVTEIELPLGRRVVSFGASHVYLVRKDELDLQWLERYRVVGTGK